MKYQVTVGDVTRDIRIEERDNGFAVAVDGRTLNLDVCRCADGMLSILHEGRHYAFTVHGDGDGTVQVHGNGSAVDVSVERGSKGLRSRLRGRAAAMGVVPIVSPMPGKVVAVLVAPGDQVKKGQGVVVVEAMKMENELASPCTGEVREVKVSPGEKVEARAVLALVEDGR